MSWNNISAYMKTLALSSSPNLRINKVVKLTLSFTGPPTKRNLNFRIGTFKRYMRRVNSLIPFSGYKYSRLYIYAVFNRIFAISENRPKYYGCSKSVEFLCNVATPAHWFPNHIICPDNDDHYYLLHSKHFIVSVIQLHVFIFKNENFLCMIWWENSTLFKFSYHTFLFNLLST